MRRDQEGAQVGFQKKYSCNYVPVKVANKEHMTEIACMKP